MIAIMKKIMIILPFLILGFVLQSCGQSENQVENQVADKLANLSEEDKAKLQAKVERANNYFKVDKLIETYESKGLKFSEKQQLQISAFALQQFLQAKKELAEVSETASEIPQEKKKEIRKAKRKLLTQNISKKVMTPEQRKTFKAQHTKEEEPNKG